MDRKSQFDQILEKWNLLDHPFYQAWNAGEISEESLALYSREYGSFISLLPKGWETLGDEETAQEEREHLEMWQQFGQALDSREFTVDINQTKVLVEKVDRYFDQATTSLGALYAFEAQQPATSRSKLDGLREHYSVPSEAETYFVEHLHTEHEAEKISAALDTLSDEDTAIALEACESTASALWDTLTGIQQAETA